MALFDVIKDNWRQRKLRQHLAAHPAPAVRNFEAARTIGILFDADQAEERQIVLEYRNVLQRDDHKKVTLLGYHDQKELSGEERYPCFCQKDLDWSQTPKGELVEEFIRTPFDWLLALHMHDCAPLEYIAAASAASFRIGHYREGKTDFYDWMLHTKNNNLRAFLDQMIDYRSKIYGKVH